MMLALGLGATLLLGVVIVLFSAAITVVFTRGSIFAPVRERGPKLWRELSSCALCSGVWVGGGIAAASVRSAGIVSVFHVLFLAVALGSLAGCLSLLFVRVLDALESFSALLDYELESKKRWEEQAKAREQLRVARARGEEPPL